MERFPPDAESVVGTLGTRMRNFEAQLAVAAKQQDNFRAELRAFAASLDSFVSKHREKDQHITRLIEEDTQRSKDAKDEYDVLASRFDHTYRPNNPTKTREFLRNVSFYITVALSFVLIAPIHAVYSILLKLLTRLGLIWQPAAYGRRADFARSRHRQRPRPISTRLEPRSRRRAKASKVSPKQKACNQHTSKLNEDPMDSVSVISSPLQKHATGEENEMLPATFPPLSDEQPIVKDDIKLDTLIADVPASHADETVHDVQHSDDDFMDAKDGNSVEGTSPNEDELEDDEDSSQSDRQDKRPGWARPLDSGGFSLEMSTFPSMEFWDISDDETKSEFLSMDGGANAT